MACFVTCSMWSCSGSGGEPEVVDPEEPEKPEYVQQFKANGVVNVIFEDDKEMKWRNPSNSDDHVMVYNRTGARMVLSPEPYQYMLPEEVYKERLYMGRLPGAAKYVVYPEMCCMGSITDDLYNYYTHYVMVFTDNFMIKKKTFVGFKHDYLIETNYMWGTLEKDERVDVDAKVVMHHQTLEMVFPIDIPEASADKSLVAVEVSTVRGSEVFTLRKHLFKGADEVTPMGDAITMHIRDYRYWDENYVCRINMLPFDLKGDELQVKVYTMDEDHLYVSTVPLKNWGPVFQAGESYTMPIDYGSLTHEVATSMNYTGSYVLADDGETLKQWTGWHPVINMEAHKELRKVKCISHQVVKNSSYLREVILPSGLLEFENAAFYGCSMLQRMEIPSGVRAIPTACFEHCNHLEECVLPERLTSIDRYAFRSCSLKSLDLPSTLTHIGEEAIHMGEMAYMICRAAVPPTMDEDALHYRYGKKVYVPAESVEAYQAADIWKDCTILSLEELGD